jgi:hypothetical protein
MLVLDDIQFSLVPEGEMVSNEVPVTGNSIYRKSQGDGSFIRDVATSEWSVGMGFVVNGHESEGK